MKQPNTVAAAPGWENHGEAPHACFCIGPQPGETLCPCMLRAKRQEDLRNMDRAIAAAMEE